MTKTVRLSATEIAGAGDPGAPMWLLRQKIMVPDLPEGFVARPGLDALCDLLSHRLTVVHAPGGFGKTTLLASLCRRERDNGRIAAWLSLDAEDDPHGLVAYLWFAFAAAGIEVLGRPRANGDYEGSDRRLNQLIHSVEVHVDPCLLVLDEVDRLDGATVRVVDWLLRNGPSNLHVALTCRILPRGLDVATSIAQGVGVHVTAEELRFATNEIARFFDGELSRRELADVAEKSQGWPIALWIHRNADKEPGSALPGPGVAANWFDRRLMSDLSDDVQALVLDAGLFDWLQESDVDDVLGIGAMQQLRSTPALVGLLQFAGGASGTAYLHPLLRQYCIDRRLRETPERYRAVHRGIAGAFARGGHIIPAVRHAREAGEARLAGEIIERAGGWRLWFRHGVGRLRAVNALLTDEIIAHVPRLAILRCMALAVAGETAAAQRLFAEARRRTQDLPRERRGVNPGLARLRADRVFDVDATLYSCLVGFIGCAPIGAPDMVETFAEVENLATAKDLDLVTLGASGYAMVAVETARSNLGSAAVWAARVRERVESHSRYFTTFADLWAGIIAMASGRVADATQAYARAEQGAMPDFMQDPGPAMIADILGAELDLERGRVGRLARRAHPLEPQLAEAAAWLDVFVPAAELLADLAERERGPAAAEDVVREALAFAQRTGRTTLTRCLTAMRISSSVATGDLGQAARLWMHAGFSARLADCAEVATQTWREMEAVACAGLRLAAACGRFEEGRELADAVLALCRERGLVRTRLRALALAIVLEHRAGDAAAAADHLRGYLRLFAQTDYVRPAVQQRATVLAVLDGLGDAVGTELARAAAALRDALVRGSAQDESRLPGLSRREREILERLEHASDKEIAIALNLSVAGVRYHVSRLFRKLGVSARRDAVRRARSLGLLPAEHRNPPP